MRQIFIVLLLLVLMQVVVQFGVDPAIDAAFDARTLVSTGFLVLAAYAFGELSRKFRLPALLGYLAAGILFGPQLANLVLGAETFAPLSSSSLRDLGLVNILAVGVIGTIGGGEIKIAELRENFGKLVAIAGTVFVVTLPLIAGAVIGLSFIAPSIVPFFADLPVSHRLAGALLFGSLAVGMSPAATLALLQEVRAHGRFTSLVLGVVVLGDLVLVATFLLLLALAKLLVSPEGLTMDRALEALPHIAAEFGWAVLIGLIVGVVFILYLRFVRREVLLFSLATVFITSFIAARVHAETLLAFLIAGFVVENFSRHGHQLVHAFERIALPVFVIYFASQAATLDLVSVTVYLPLTLILVALRVGLFYFGVGFGARMAGVEDPSRRNLQVAFFSQGGVDLVLAGMIAEGIPGWGVEVQTVTMATVLIYVIGGPPLLAKALDRMGESAAARERGTEQLEAEATVPHERRAGAEAPRFVAPKTDHPALNAPLASLHALVLELAGPELGAGIRERAAVRNVEVRELATLIRTSLEFGPEIARDDRGLPELAELRQRLVRLDAEVAERARGWETLALMPFDRPQLEHLLVRLASAQRFSSNLRVLREASLFAPQGSRFSRLIRAVRRMRRALVGPGTRTIPLGRLWRYHVTLEVPVSLWGTLQPNEALAWHNLRSHYQLTRARLEALGLGEWETVAIEPPAAEHADHADHADHDEHAEHAEHADGDPSDSGSSPVVPVEPIRADTWIATALAQARAREVGLEALLATLDEPLEVGFRAALDRAWTGFLNSVELAGTLELPAWRHRPSRRYDAARAATEELGERSDRDREAAEGRRDGLRALVEARCQAAQTQTRAEQFGLHLEESLAPIRGGFDLALVRTSALVAAGHVDELPAGGSSEQGEHTAVARGRALAAELDAITVALEQMRRRMLEQRSHDFGEPGRALAQVPALLNPSAELTTEPNSATESKRTPLRLQAWLAQTLAREFAATLSAVEDELATGLTGVRVAVHHTREVLGYHLGDGTGTITQLDEGLGERISALLERARAQLDLLMETVQGQVWDKLSEAEAAALEPLLGARWDEVRRRSRRLDDPSTAISIGNRLRERGHKVAVNSRALIQNVGDELGALLSERATAGASAAYRDLVFGERSSMPEAYQRLFTSVPAEIVGLLIDRPELLGSLNEAINRGQAARVSAPILLWGERGAGKRTLIRQAIAELERSSGGDSSAPTIHWLRLTPTLEREPQVAAELARMLGWPPADDFTILLERLQTMARLMDAGQRKLVVLENAERLFRRTPEGLDTVRRLFELIAGTGAQIQWVVLMVDVAVRVLDPALELRARFSLALHVPGVVTDEVERVLDARHRLSGYALRREPGRPTLHEWLREPTTAWRRWRNRSAAISERITELSGGNLRQALRLWLAAARLDEDNPSTVVVGPLPSDPSPLTEELPLSSKLLLGSLLLYGPLLRRELERVHGWVHGWAPGQALGQAPGQVSQGSAGVARGETLDLDAELTRLAQLQLVIIEEDDRAQSRDDAAEALIRIETRLAQPLAAELRSANLI